MEKAKEQGKTEYNHESQPKVMKEIPEEKTITVEMPINAVEPFFNALSSLKPATLGKLEFRAVQLFKEQVLMELELYMETPEEKEKRQTKFFGLFSEIREQKKRIEPNTKSYNV